MNKNIKVITSMYWDVTKDPAYKFEKLAQAIIKKHKTNET